MILVDYERGYEQMFDKPPKLVKKVDDRSIFCWIQALTIRLKTANFKKKDSMSEGKKESAREELIEITGNAVVIFG
jgi:hypothetical protein